MKESESSSIGSVLNSLFTPLSKKKVKDLGLTESEERKYVGRLGTEVGGSGREGGVASGKPASYHPASPHYRDTHESFVVL
jgi:chromosome transmission fidelity protein 18